MRTATRACWAIGILGAGLSAWWLLRPRYDRVWNARDALPESVNTPGVEVYEPNFAPDGKSLIFTRGSAGKGTDLLRVDIARDGTPRGTPEPLPGIATEFDEIDGMLGRDGVLCFYSDRPGGLGGYDLYAARQRKDGGFDPPANLGAAVNSEFNDYDPCLSPDGKFLYFSSNRHSAGSEEDYDLYVCLRTSDGWSKPRALAGVNTPANEWEPMLARDGRTLYFTSNRARPVGDGGAVRTDFDLFAATLERKSGWGNAANLGPEVNSEHDEFDPAIHPRNDALLFVRGLRDGEAYDVRIWRAAPRPVPLGPIVRLDRLPRALLLAAAALAGLLGLLWALIAGWRRLSTLQKCLLASLAAHCLAAWILTMVALTSRFEEFRRSDSAFSAYTDIPEDAPQDVLLTALFHDASRVEVSRAPQPDVAPVPEVEPVRMDSPPAPAVAVPEPQRASPTEPLPELASAPLPAAQPVEAETAEAAEPAWTELAPPAAPVPSTPVALPPARHDVAPVEPAALQPVPTRPEPPARDAERTPATFRPDAVPQPTAAPAPEASQAAPAALPARPPAATAQPAVAAFRPFAPELTADAPALHTAVRPVSQSQTQLASVRFDPGAAEVRSAGSRHATPSAAPQEPEPAVPAKPSLGGLALPGAGPAFAQGAFVAESAQSHASAPVPSAPSRPRSAVPAARLVDWTPGASELAAARGAVTASRQGADSATAAPPRPARGLPAPSAPLPPPLAPAAIAYRPAALLPGPSPTTSRAPRRADRERVPRIRWSAPTNLGPTINRGGETYEPNLSADGRTLYFTHGPAGGEANLFRSERVGGGWTAPMPIEALNGESDDIDATLDGEGRTVHFYSDRPGGMGGYDLYASLRGDDGEWIAPTNLGTRVNSEWNDYDPHIGRDGKRLFFASNRQSLGSEGDYDLYGCEWREDVGWSEPVRLPLNTLANDWEPALSPDGLSLYFSSNRPGGRGGYDLWVSHFRDGQWQPPQPLDGAVNSERDELDPAVSPDGETLLFVSNRAGSHGTFDIWQTKRRLME